MPKSKKLVRAEELFNSISHAFGVLMSIAFLVLLIIFASIRGNAWMIVSFSVFGSSMIALYLTSTIFHSTKNLRKKSRLNLLDHSMIYVLIAGTYTPISLVTLNGLFGWIIFGIIWGLAIIGVIYKLFYYKGYYFERKLSAYLYVGMGLIIVAAAVPLVKNTSSTTLWFIIAGCLSYCFGVVFYIVKKIPFGHGIFHLTIISGSVCHFFAFLFMMI